MTEYTVMPLTEPDWMLDPADLAARVQARWPEARVLVGSVEGSTMAVEALVPMEPPPRELGIALSGNGQAISLDPADPDSAAAFACWFVEQFPSLDPPLHLIEDGSMRGVELTRGVTEATVLAGLR